MKDFLIYYCIRCLLFPLSYLPLSVLRLLGKVFGLLAYYLLKEFRKTALSNLALAKKLSLSPDQIVTIGKQSFQNLAINILEYGYFHRKKDLFKVIRCTNPQIAQNLFRKKQGIVFFCGHQSNWEALFLDGNRLMKGIAIGKPTKNKRIYQWILSIRQKTGGVIISPKNALKEGLRALRKGYFMGILSDQGMPDSNYSFPFLGRRAWSTTAPALLAYKTNCPIIVATTQRKKNGYDITYSAPIWPDLSRPIEEEVVRMMDNSFQILEDSIVLSPGEWLWQHNRWKQQTPHNIYKTYRKDSLAIILPNDKKSFDAIVPSLHAFKDLYKNEFLFVFMPRTLKCSLPFTVDEIIYYDNIKDLYRRDYRFKLVFNFTALKHLKAHFLKLSAFAVIDYNDLIAIAKNRIPHLTNISLQNLLLAGLCRGKKT